MVNLKLTVIQSDIHWHTPVENVAMFESLIHTINDDTDIVLLPEMFTTGFTMEPGHLAENMEGITVAAMKKWSRELKSSVAGSLIIEENGLFFNRLVAVTPDGEIFTCDKRHLFRMAGEQKIYTAGKDTITMNIKGWKVRPFICYDLRFPVWSRNIGNEYDLAFYCANWPAARAFHWDTLLRARAIENQCYVAGINRTGIDGKGVKYNGDSCIIGFSGETIFSAGRSVSVHTTELSYSALQDYRRNFPAWMDADQFRINI